MFLYLKFNNSLKRVPEITFHKCLIPKIAEVTETRIEPAIWFKVLILNSVLVDCDSKKVFWTVESLPREFSFHHVDEFLIDYFKTQERLFEDMEYDDYDPIVDELFDMATEIARQHLQGQLNSESLLKILQLLHCFILPKIKLKIIYMQNLEAALKVVNQELKEVEENIQDKDNAKWNMENSLCKQREKMMQMDDFTKEFVVANCNREFLDFFLTHILRDVRKANEKLVLLQEGIDKLRNSSTEDNQESISDMRKKRDLEHNEITKLQTVRETIKNVIGRSHVKKKKRKLPKKKPDSILFQEIYVEISQRYQNVMLHIHELLMSKLKINCVREAINLTMEELKEEGESVGYHHKLGSNETDTHILDLGQTPAEWLTLEEKVQKLFDRNHNDFQSKLEKFCESVIDKCQQVMGERNMFGAMDVTIAEEETGTCMHPDKKMEYGLPLNPTSIELLNIMGRASQCRRTYNSQSVNSRSCIRPRVDSLALSQGIPQVALEGITKSIMENLTEMSKDIAVEISSENDKIPSTLVNRMYINYEKRVAEKLMPKLVELYIIKFESNIRSLRTWLDHVTLAEIGIDDTCVHKLMAPKNVSSVHIPEPETESLNEEETMMKHSPSSEDDWHHESPRSICLGKCSLTELYKYADRDCVDMPEFFENSPVNEDVEDHINSSEESESLEFLESIARLSESPDSQGMDESYKIQGILNKSDPFSDCQDNCCGKLQNPSSPAEDIYVQMRFLDLSKSKDGPEKNCPSHTDEINLTIDDSDKIYVEMRFPTRTRPDIPNHYDVAVFNGNGARQAFSSVSPMFRSFVAKFDKFEDFFSKMTSCVSIFKKLHHITNVLRYTEEQLKGIKEDNGDSSPVMSDDLLTTIIILLTHMNPELLHHVHAHLNLIMALLPPFLSGSAHGYALVTLYSAFQYLNEQFELHRTRPS